MTNRLTKQLMIAASVLVLGGCSWFSPNPQSRTFQNSAGAGKAGAERHYQSATDQGREHLRANRTGQAIEAFNVALATGEEPAAAYNGLGVSYARLGRRDLAYRFFKKASMSDPDNPVYSRNLATLMDSPGFNLAAMRRGESQLAPPSAPQQEVAAAPAVAERTPGKLHREGRGQYSLVSALPMDDRPSRPALGSAACKAKSASCQPQRALPQVASRTVPAAAPKVAAAPSANPAAEPKAAAIQPELPKTPRRKVIEMPPSAGAGEARTKPAADGPRRTAAAS